MGRVVIEARVENLKDLWDVEPGARYNRARVAEVKDALVDTGATLLSMPTRLIHLLGLKKSGMKRITSSVGAAEAAMYEAVRLTIQGRQCTMDVMEVPNEVPALIGQIPLEHLDFVIDPRNRSLIGNPALAARNMSMSCIETSGSRLPIKKNSE